MMTKSNIVGDSLFVKKTNKQKTMGQQDGSAGKET